MEKSSRLHDCDDSLDTYNVVTTNSTTNMNSNAANGDALNKTPTTTSDPNLLPLQPIITRPDGRIIDAKNTLKSFDMLTTSQHDVDMTPRKSVPNVASKIAPKNSHPLAAVTLQNGRLVDAKNTLQSFVVPTLSPHDAAPAVTTTSRMNRDDDGNNTKHLVLAIAPNNGVEVSPHQPVVPFNDDNVSVNNSANGANIVGTNHNENQHSNGNHNRNNNNHNADTIHAEVVQTAAIAEPEAILIDSIIESSRLARNSKRRRIFCFAMITFAMIAFTAVITGIGVYCGTGNCSQPKIQVACNFLLLTNTDECQTTTSFNGTTLGGTIPSEIGLLTQLNVLDLSENGLTGSMPSTLGNLVNLRTLVLARNQLNGTISSTIGKLVELNYLDLDWNTIPSTIGSLNLLSSLILSGNELTGTLPSILENLVELMDLSIYYNHLTGTIPSAFGKLVRLKRLSLDLNQLVGTISSSLGNLDQLTYLDLGTNGLTGTIPSVLGNLMNISGLSIRNNKLTGTIPSTLGSLVQITWLDLGTNDLTGTIPSTLGDLDRLEVLGLQLIEMSLSHNELTGTIPSTLGKLKQLEYLSLENNTQLSGTIPSSLCYLDNVIRIEIDSSSCRTNSSSSSSSSRYISCSCCTEYPCGTV